MLNAVIRRFPRLGERLRALRFLRELVAWVAGHGGSNELTETTNVKRESVSIAPVLQAMKVPPLACERQVAAHEGSAGASPSR